RIEGETLATLARDYMEVRAIIDRWGRRYDANVLSAMLWLPVVEAEQLAAPERMREWSEQLQQRLKLLNGAGPVYRVHYQPGTEGVEASILVTREYHGLTSTKTIHDGFFRSPEYRRISAVGASFKDLVHEGAYIERGKERHDVETLPDAIEWMMEQAKQGQSIQRYKGLGEMNPTQL
ncbi:MAG: DNA gyrase subunit B, partial [Gammaproteobacteria bacterium]|nr:DNA gyrase subunit B [Gammaproteobacteria bacterium]